MARDKDIPAWAWWLLFGILAYPVGKAVTNVVFGRLESARLEKLAPDVKNAFFDFVRAAAQEGYRVFAGRTAGTKAETAVHKAEGRSSVNVSWHDLRPPRAIDIKVGLMGKSLVTSPKEDNPQHVTMYRDVLRIAERYGFRQIGFFQDGSIRHLSSGAWDPYHIEYRGPFANIQQAIAATGVA